LYCAYCGHRSPDEALFCQSCGRRLKGAEAPSTAPIPAAPASTATPGSGAEILSVGQVVCGDYEVLRLIGASPDGEIYQTRHHLTGQPAMIKAIPTASVAAGQATDRLLAEARLLAQVDHPNLLRLFNFRREGSRYLAVLQVPAGQPLEDVLQAAGTLALPRFFGLLAQVLEGLSVAHQAGLIHGRLTTREVVVDEQDRVKITGFDRFLSAPDGQLPRGLGAARHLAPEQIRNHPADERTDLYAVGVMAFEALAGRPPFDGSSEFDIMRAHVDQPVPDLLALRPEVPLSVAQAIAAALAKDPAARPASATAFLADLLNVGNLGVPEAMSGGMSGVFRLLASGAGPAAPARPEAPRTPAQAAISGSIQARSTTASGAIGGPARTSGTIPGAPRSPQPSEPARTPPGGVREAHRSDLRGATAPSPGQPARAAAVPALPALTPLPAPVTPALPPGPAARTSGTIQMGSGTGVPLPSPPELRPPASPSRQAVPQLPDLLDAPASGPAGAAAHSAVVPGPPPPLPPTSRSAPPSPTSSARPPSVPPLTPPGPAAAPPRPAGAPGPAPAPVAPAPAPVAPAPAPVAPAPAPASVAPAAEPARLDAEAAESPPAPVAAPVLAARRDPLTTTPFRGLQIQSHEEGNFFVTEGGAADGPDDFSDLEEHDPGAARRLKLIGLAVLAVVLLFGGGLWLYRTINPYARSGSKTATRRPASWNDELLRQAHREGAGETLDPAGAGGAGSGDGMAAKPPIDAMTPDPMTPPPPPPKPAPDPRAAQLGEEAKQALKASSSKAEQLAEEALKLDPEQATARQVLAGILESKSKSHLGNGWNGKAIEAASRAIQLDPASKEAYFYLGLANHELGRKPEAKAALSEYVKRCPSCGENSTYAQSILRGL
jgi:serine/threonine-protein kinase